MPPILTQTLEAEIASKRAEIEAQEVQTSRTQRVLIVQPLKDELQSLIEQNNEIVSANATLVAEYVPPLAEYKVIAQNEVKAACKTHILNNYSVEKQRNAGMDIYTFETCMAMSQFIADCIEEENRCNDAIDIAADIVAVDAVTATWPVVV